MTKKPKKCPWKTTSGRDNFYKFAKVPVTISDFWPWQNKKCPWQTSLFFSEILSSQLKLPVFFFFSEEFIGHSFETRKFRFFEAMRYLQTGAGRLWPAPAPGTFKPAPAPSNRHRHRHRHLRWALTSTLSGIGTSTRHLKPAPAPAPLFNLFFVPALALLYGSYFSELAVGLNLGVFD